VGSIFEALDRTVYREAIRDGHRDARKAWRLREALATSLPGRAQIGADWAARRPASRQRLAAFVADSLARARGSTEQAALRQRQALSSASQPVGKAR